MPRILSTLVFLLGSLSLAMAEQPTEAAVEDYGKLRMAFAESENFNPFALQALERKLSDQAMDFWKEGRAGEATDLLEQLIQIFPLSMEGHIRLADGFKLLLDSGEAGDQKAYYQDRERNHRYVFEGLVQSALDSGDGKTADTGFEIISFGEEAWILRKLRLRPLDRSVDKENQQVVYQTVTEDGVEQDVFFDASSIFKALETLREAEEKEAENPSATSESPEEP